MTRQATFPEQPSFEGAFPGKVFSEAGRFAAETAVGVTAEVIRELLELGAAPAEEYAPVSPMPTPVAEQVGPVAVGDQYRRAVDVMGGLGQQVTSDMVGNPQAGQEETWIQEQVAGVDAEYVDFIADAGDEAVQAARQQGASVNEEMANG